MKVEHLVVTASCPICLKVKHCSFTAVNSRDNDPDAVELVFCTCDMVQTVGSSNTIEPDHLSIMCTGVGPELIHIPPGSSIFPDNHFQQQEEKLWQIAQEVAETDSTHIAEPDGRLVCPFCSAYEGDNGTWQGFAHNDTFSHEKNCIVTKARALMEWRKAQPRIEVNIKKDGE
jgi:uncharacterized Zn-finger protein